MKGLIVYSSKYGYTRECAYRIGDSLSDTIVVVDIKKEKVKEPISQYDLCIIGSGIYAGSTTGVIKSFCTKYEKELLTIPTLGLFICGTDPDHIEETFKKCFSSALLEKAVIKEWFGGRILLSDFKGIMHFFMKKMLKGENTINVERPEVVEQFIAQLKARISP